MVKTKMAAQSAHLTSLNLIKPSIFDFIAQEALNDLLKPAVRQLTESVCIKYPRTSWLLWWYDECFLFCSSLLHFYYLKTYGGSFSESLYGLRRVGSSKKALTKQEILLSLTTLTLVPYVLHKLQAKAEKMYFNSTTKTLQEKSFIQLNSTIQLCFQLAKCVQYLRFIGGKTKYNSPLLQLIRQRLIIDHPAQQQNNSRNWLAMFIRRGFELSLFFMQCCQTWESDGKRTFLHSGDIPPPAKIQSSLTIEPSICPICRGERKDSTVLGVSGMVFCFTCIWDYINRFQACPITRCPASVDDLIRLINN